MPGVCLPRTTGAGSAARCRGGGLGAAFAPRAHCGRLADPAFGVVRQGLWRATSAQTVARRPQDRRLWPEGGCEITVSLLIERRTAQATLHRSPKRA